jgi:hypothetical protein
MNDDTNATNDHPTDTGSTNRVHSIDMDDRVIGNIITTDDDHDVHDKLHSIWNTIRQNLHSKNQVGMTTGSIVDSHYPNDSSTNGNNNYDSIQPMDTTGTTSNTTIHTALEQTIQLLQKEIDIHFIQEMIQMYHTIQMMTEQNHIHEQKNQQLQYEIQQLRISDMNHTKTITVRFVYIFSFAFFESFIGI